MGGMWGYPIMPVGPGGFTFGMGTFHPGVMLIEGMGHLAVHSFQGMMYVGNSIFDGVGGAFSAAGGGWGGPSLPEGEGGGIVLGLIIAFIVIIILAAMIYGI